MPIHGFADLHCHPMAHLAFGGKTFAGKPDGGPVTPSDLAKALERCDAPGQFHSLLFGQVAGGPGAELVSLLVRAAIEWPHGTCGHPGFGHWPRFTTVVHQQMYVEWLRRAHTAGLRLICALMVNNELLARQHDGVRYSDFNAVESQLTELRAFVARHSDFLSLVKSADEAEGVMQAGRVAVVAGIEVDTLESFARHGPNDEPHNPAFEPSAPTKSLNAQPLADAEVATVLQHLKALGVSMVTPLHLADNSLGGAAIYGDVFNLLNRFLRGHWFGVHTDPAIQFQLGRDLKARVASKFLGYGNLPGYSWVHGHRNAQRLTPLGAQFLEAAMRAGLLIDVDHMSQLTTDDALHLAVTNDYPMLSSHSAFRELGLSRDETSDAAKLCHEGMRTRAQAKTILELGGLVAPITNQHEVLPYGGALAARVENTCARSTRTWAQSYLLALELRQEAGRGGVAFGTDFNGLNQQTGPRFGTYAASGLLNEGVLGDVEADRETEYSSQKYAQAGTALVYGKPQFFERYSTGPLPLTKAALSGRADFDFNTDGLAHYGLLPDFIEDVRSIVEPASAADSVIEPLFQSAQAFVDMWRRCETRAKALNGP